ncbi:MAG: hypothetical protein U0936_13380 [Planctomycetaceae bacterium]
MSQTRYLNGVLIWLIPPHTKHRLMAIVFVRDVFRPLYSSNAERQFRSGQNATDRHVNRCTELLLLGRAIRIFDDRLRDIRSSTAFTSGNADGPALQSFRGILARVTTGSAGLSGLARSPGAA